ncbi:hypothetical protein BX257_4745 [Streptomyces sp. 3212.3]|uniref:hypothetical protein n=1 Tax=Streptomyces sp. 3212.3 TaxID=1938846 RepID=UPI000E24F6D1|nr:hypothetical protein [Streptomyces sp. 3212.3]REE62132.1 hypothetical protein BX257_4745 [Streptomyces sp. 3212.3]
MSGDIVMTRVPGGIRVLTAPDRASITLQLLAEACSHELRVHGDLITIADQVVYRVIGWQPDSAALTVALFEDRRTPEESQR